MQAGCADIVREPHARQTRMARNAAGEDRVEEFPRFRIGFIVPVDDTKRPRTIFGEVADNVADELLEFADGLAQLLVLSTSRPVVRPEVGGLDRRRPARPRMPERRTVR